MMEEHRGDCSYCRYEGTEYGQEPCNSCIHLIEQFDFWEPKIEQEEKEVNE